MRTWLSHTVRGATKYVLAIIVGTMGAVLIGDVALRLAPAIGTRPEPEYNNDILEYSDDARLGWQLRPGVGDHNAGGFRGRPTTPIPVPGTTRIATTGDSVTYGLGLTADQAFPAALERHLNAHGAARYEVLNFGVPGYSTFQVRQQLDAVLEWHPHVLLMTFSTDDSETSPVVINVGGTYAMFRNPFERHWWLDSDTHWRLARWSPLYRLTSQALQTLASGQIDPDAVVLRPEVARANVHAIADVSRTRGIPFVVALSPFIPPYPDTPYARQALSAMTDLESSLSASASLVLNLEPVYRDGGSAYRWSGTDIEHHSPAGAEAVGAFLGAQMRARLLR